jgi:DNA helicase-2/ATP-dependent DNA helicase PcrA
MYRTNAQSRALEDACVSYGVAYKLVGGVGFYKRREIRDLVAYLRVINNPNEELSFKRIINVPGRGIGDKSIATFERWTADRRMTFTEGLEALARGEPSPITGKAARGFAAFGALIHDLRAMAADEDFELTALFDEIMARTGYSLHVTEISDTPDQATERMENLNALRGLLADKADLTLADFLEDVSLVSEIDQVDDNKDGVTLLTMHAAKGLEFPVVFITGVEDGLLPHSRSFNEPHDMEEERRLFYVGLTRAKDYLYLTYTFRRSLYGDSVPSIVSRFLSDIPEDLTEGASLQVKQLRNHAGYQQATTWERGEYPPRDSKIISFEQAQRALPSMRYRAGQRVMHPKLGEGYVLDSRRQGDDEEVEVRFTKHGTKRLLASFANLLILDR